MQLLMKASDAIFKHSILKYFHIITTHNKYKNMGACNEL